MKKKPTREELYKINEALPELMNFLRGDKEVYKKIFVSVFEKWLKPEELDQLYTQNDKILAERRYRFEKIICDFYEMTNTYLWRCKRHNRIIFYRPNSLKHLLVKVNIKNQNYWTGQRYDIILPELSCIYSEESDWTNIIWYREFNKIEPLLQVVKSNGLYVIK